MRRKFFGCYLKCQSDTKTLAVIPAIHGKTCSVQLITDDGAWNFTKDLGLCRFSNDGFTLDLHGDGVSVTGEVKFGPFIPPRYDVMGPFRYVPFLQCRHGVLSMLHRVDGTVDVNGVPYVFRNAQGYIEGDRGCSFPAAYAWTQTFFDGGSLMCSAAEIPSAGFRFTGVIAVILYHGKEYRLATYLGARAVKKENGEVVIRQGDYTFSAKLLQKNADILHAPVNGKMLRTIRESVSCRAAYRLEKDGKLLFAFETDRASFEFEYGGEP